MADEEKDHSMRKRGKYESPLKVESNFMDLMGAVVKNANNKQKTNNAPMYLSSSNRGNADLSIDQVVIFTVDDRADHEGIYCIRFVMVSSKKIFWEYNSKKKRDIDYERIHKDFKTYKATK